jgi:hypothetical protein
MDLHKTYNCNLCDKKYKHRQSLNNHNRKFHSEKSLKNHPNITNISPTHHLDITQISPIQNKNNVKGDYICKYCGKKYRSNNGRWKHEKKCELLKQKENEELQKQNEELKLMLKKQEKDNTQKIIKQEKLIKQYVAEINDKKIEYEKLMDKVSELSSNSTDSLAQAMSDQLDLMKEEKQQITTKYNELVSEHKETKRKLNNITKTLGGLI